MLRMIARRSSAAVKSYYARDDAAYYTENFCILGTWGGKAAAKLGLTGPVDADRFDALCDNLHPDTGDRLTLRTKANRTIGYDLVFNAPKSVSLVHAWTSDHRIVQAITDAVNETMSELEAEVRTRVRVNGADEDRVTGNLAWAAFPHFTTRPIASVADPHLHIHAFAFNATFDGQEDRWKAGQFRQINEAMPYYEAAFMSRLALKLQELGYPVERRDRAFEIVGISDSLLRKFSNRTALIEKTAEERGITDDRAKSRLGGMTRESKNTEVAFEEQTRIWESRMSDADRRERQQILNIYQQQRLPTAPALSQVSALKTNGTTHVRPTEDDRMAVESATMHAFERQSVVRESQFLAEAVRFGMCRATPEGIRAAVAERPDIIREQHDGQWKITTRAVLAEEKAMTDWVKSTRGTAAPLAPFHAIRDEQLNDQQRAAVRHVLESQDRVVLVIGKSGVGKTRLLKEAVAGMEAQGHKVLVMAPGSELARETLPKEGLPNSETVAMFLTNRVVREAYRGGVWWIDEAGQLSSPTMSKLCQLADELNARIVLSGDPMQHRSVQRGDALIILHKYGELQVAVASKIIRQTGIFREAVDDLSKGHIDAAFDKLNTMNALHEIPDEGERHSQLVADYVQVLQGGKTALVISPTHAEGRKVTDIIRSELKRSEDVLAERPFSALRKIDFTEAEQRDVHSYRAGWVLEMVKSAPGYRCGQRLRVSTVADGTVYVRGSDGIDRPFPVEKYGDRFGVYEHDVLNIGVGEHVRITKNGRSIDGSRKLSNGSFCVVTGFTAGGDIMLDNGVTISRNYAHLAHGYATTSHAAQGKTVDWVFIAESEESFPAASREQVYVSVSRAREGAGLYTTTIEGLKDAVKSSGQRLSASDLVHGKRSAGLAPDHEEEIRQAQRRAELSGESVAPPDSSKIWLGQLPTVTKQFPEYLPNQAQEQISRRRGMGFGR